MRLIPMLLLAIAMDALLVGCAPLGPCLEGRFEDIPRRVRMTGGMGGGLAGDIFPEDLTWTETVWICTKRGELIDATDGDD